MSETIEVERDVLERVLKTTDKTVAGPDQRWAVEKLRWELWEPYEPCPVCGDQQSFGERVLVDSPVNVYTTESGSTYPEYKDPTYGDTEILECHNCGNTLIEDGEKVSFEELVED